MFRCRLGVGQSSSDAVPGTVIVRLPREGAARSGSAPLDSERAAIQHLASVGSTLAPRYYAGGADAGFLASEDLGTGPSLLDLLLGKDPEAATQGGAQFRTEPRTASYTDILARTLYRRQSSELAARPETYPKTLGTGKGVCSTAWPSHSTGRGSGHCRDSQNSRRHQAYIALSSGDPSVVNCKVINGQVSFLDFEEACLRPALVDAAVLHFLYPTGGPSWQVPRGMALQLESVYRAELARVCPAATEDASSYGGIAAAGAAWMILRMARLPLVDAGPDRDPWQLLPPDWSGPIPARSRRRQLVAIVETWIGLAGRANSLCALATWCESVTGALRDRWPEASEEFPFYPAFK